MKNPFTLSWTNICQFVNRTNVSQLAVYIMLRMRAACHTIPKQNMDGECKGVA